MNAKINVYICLVHKRMMQDNLGFWVSSVGYTRDDITSQECNKYYLFVEDDCDICKKEVNFKFTDMCCQDYKQREV